MTIKAGEAFDPLSVVRDAVDDKDDKNTLYQHIHTDGTYDVRTPGSYEIRYYVTDSSKPRRQYYPCRLKTESQKLLQAR